MSSIEPKQLLGCLSGLLSNNGGIKRRNEVQRIARLMSKYSKKLVSKCIYIQILKCTETELLDLFMRYNGWLLIHLWLTESIVAKNWPLVKELLELLLLCPVDLNRLKTNNCPKLVKELSKDGDHFAIRALASKLVEQWLKTVQGEKVVPVLLSDIPQIISDGNGEIKPEIVKLKSEVEQAKDTAENEESTVKTVKTEECCKSESIEITPTVKEENQEPSKTEIKIETDQQLETLPVLKISLKDGVQTVLKVEDTENKDLKESPTSEKLKENSKNKDKDKSSEKTKSSHTKSNSSKHSSKARSSSDKHKSSSSSSRHSSSKDKKKDKDKDRSSHSSKSKSDSSKKSSSSSSSSNSSSSSKTKDDRSTKNSEKEKREKDEKLGKKKDKDTKEKSDESNEHKTPSISKLGKIPKLSDLKKEKPSISIEVRKPDDPKPKTVKAYNSKFRKHGLEEEIKPPPSRSVLLNKKAPPPPIPPIVSIPKRHSPVHNETPPEKKLKTMEIVEKPGSIKLIPPKPKPMTLLESDMFMDALNASATNKKEPKKRKRRTSGSKDGNPNDGSPPPTPTSLSSPTSESKSVPPRFYQDTLDAEERKDKSHESKEPVSPVTTENEVEDDKMDVSGPHTLTVNGLKGVLCYHRKKGPKKNIKWKPDSELETIHVFDLDETERINVTKTFTDMKYLERIHEREAFEKARNLSNDDVMEERTNWKPLILVDLEGQLQVDYGKNSKEKDIQALRQKVTLQPLYFNKAMIPDSPIEPELETHTYSEPSIIPLEDVTGNQDNISDFRNMPWPEPRGNAPPQTPSNMTVGASPLFPNNLTQFSNTFPNTQFPGVPPAFQGPNIVPGEWQNGIPQQMIPNGMPGPIGTHNLAPGVMPPGSHPQGMMISPETMMMAPEMFGNPTPMFPVPPESFNMQQNMYPMDFNMVGPPGPGPEGFNGPGPGSGPGPGNFRGAMRGRGVNGHWRGKGAGNWENPSRGGRGGGPRGNRKTICMYFQRKGSCRQGDNCTFLHPGVNCPF